MLSLHVRQLMAASLVLVAFLGLTGLALDRAFQRSALVAVQDRLRAQVYLLLSAAELNQASRLVLPATLPEARFSTPDSGLYAEISDANNTLVWRSDSTVGMPIPVPTAAEPGQFRFQPLAVPGGAALFALDLTVSWEVEPGKYRRYTFRVAETQQSYAAQVAAFRRNLWGWLLAAAFVLLLVQGMILRWSLKPLRQVARQVVEIEAGRRTVLTGPYPKELRALMENLNALIRHSHAHLERYRNALGDLAHSLKTPLAVLRNAVATQSGAAELLPTVQEQVERMNQTVEYHLHKAAASGRIALAAPVSVATVVRKVLDALAKVYRDKAIQFALQVDHTVVFYGEEGDLLEILGNLADNACKWCRQQVAISAYLSGQAAQTELVLAVEDDGPGIPDARQRIILARGGRADPSVAGQGIGLAVVKDIVEEVYRGHLEMGRSSLGGARVQVHLQI